MKNRHDQLVLKKLIGTINSKEQAELEAWLNQNPNARKRYDQAVADWKRKQWNSPDSFNYQTPVQESHIKTYKTASQAGSSSRSQTVAKNSNPTATSRPSPVSNFRDSASLAERGRTYVTPASSVAAATTQPGAFTSEHVEPGYKKRYRIAEGIAVALICISSFSLFMGLREYPELHRSGEGITKVLLKDSSSVTLKPKSAIKVSGHYLKENRTVYLYGDGYFQVKQLAKPFIVQTSNASLTSTGNAFLVKASKDAGSSTVMVLSGKVKVTPLNNPANPVMLFAGQRGEIAGTGRTVAVTSFDSLNALAWKERVLIFKKTPLDEAISTFEDYFNVDIEVKNPDIGNCTLSRTFREPNIMDIVEMMRRTFGLTVMREPGKLIVSGKGCRFTSGNKKIR